MHILKDAHSFVHVAEILIKIHATSNLNKKSISLILLLKLQADTYYRNILDAYTRVYRSEGRPFISIRRLH